MPDYTSSTPPEGMNQAQWEWERGQKLYGTQADGSKTANGNIYNTAISGGQNAQGIGQGIYTPGDIDQTVGFARQSANGLSYSGASQANAYGSLANAAQYGQYGNDQSYQNAALAETQRVANGGMSSATMQGQQALRNGAASQYQIAGSALGGSLGQAAAMRGAAQGNAGYMAQGNQQLQAQQAQEQASAQQQVMQQTANIRNANQAGLGTSASLANGYAGAANDAAVYQQNAISSMGNAGAYWTGQLQNQLTTNYGQQQGQADYQQNVGNSIKQNKANSDAADQQELGAGIGAAASTLSMGVFGSDTRIKEPVSLADAAEMRYWR